MRTLPLTNRGLPLPAMVTLVLVMVLAALVAGASAVSAQGTVPDAPDQPIATAVFVAGVDLEWNDVPGADSYDVQLYRNGQWIDLPGEGVEIAFYGAGAIISGLDPNSTLWFQVRAENAHGSSDWSNFSSVASTNQFKLGRRARPDNVPASGAPVINGTAQVGEILTVDTTGIEDGNGLDRVQFRFQWISHDGSADTDIASATDSTYTLAAGDEGKTIKVRVAFTDRGGYAESLTGAATEQVAPSAHANPAPTPEPAQNSPATGSPAVTGTAQVGEALSADISGIGDADGLANVSYSYQWVRNDGTSDTDITGAADSSYILVAADEGKTIKVRVAFTDRGGYGESLTSAATATVAAAPNNPATGAPTISGTARVGEPLTADTSGIADTDGLTNVTYSYQWITNDGTADSDITSATDSTYILVAADEGKTIKVEVSFTDDAGNGETLTSAATSSVAARPNSAATGAPTISGTAHVEETLTAGTSGIGDADGLTNVSYNYQWIANDGTSDTDITGATDSSYILVAADEGKTIKVRVSFTDDAANDEVLTSTETEAVSFAVQQQIVNNPATGAPTISGAAQVGEALTADTSGIADTDGLVNATYRYQWMRNDGTSETDIQNATGSTYTLVDNDEGQTIKVKVSFTDDAGNDETLSSGATDAVAAPECDNIGDCDIEDVDDLLLPDLVSYVHEYSVAEVVATPDGTEFFALRFAGFVTNLGDGPLDLRGNPQLADDADLASHDVWQRALTIDGDWVNLTKPPIDFEVDDGHDHFHVMGIVEYSLWDTSGTVEISSGAKIGFCLIDVVERPDLHANPGPKRHEQWDPDNYYCQSGRPRAKILHMGVSEGWQDIYSFSETFQWIDVSDVQPGYYRIGQRADPDNVIVESDETNNELVLTQRLQVVPGYVARPETVSVEPDAAVRFKLSVDEYFDDTNLEDGSLRTRAHRIVTQPSHGSLDVGDTVTVIVDGATHQVFTDEWVTYTPDPGYTGVDSFTFVALDESRPRYPINPVVAKVTVLSAGKVGITGFPRIGEVLTATTTGIADADGFESASFNYQWIRNDGGADADITGATDSNYVLVDADWGSTIKVRVSFTDDAGYAWTLTSEATAQVSGRPGVPELPVGTAVFIGGVDLEWDDVIWADSYDVQLFRNGQWTDLPADDVAIAFYGAGAIISGLDPESSLWFRVRAENAHSISDWSEMLYMDSTNESTSGRRAKPDNVPASGAPVISGTAQLGESLTADTTGIEDGNGLDRVQFRFQWISHDGSADADIASATDYTYTLLASDEGKTIKVRVAFTDRGGYAESLTSAATATVAAAASDSPATGAPVITGTAEVGETLTADTTGVADADGLSGATFTYRWIANDGTADTDIQDAMDSTYTLVAADEGKTIKVRVSFTDDAGNVETLTSSATAAVDAAPNTPATGASAITGTAQVGETLAADTSGIADADGLTKVSYSYQWVANDGTADTDITDATDSTYTLSAPDEGKTIKVKVSFTDDRNNKETLTSEATAAVAATVPGAPQNVQISLSASHALEVSWEAPTSDGGSAVTGYKVRWKKATGSWDTPEDVSEAVVTGVIHTIAGLTEGTAYSVRVLASNEVGDGSASAELAGTPRDITPPSLSTATVNEAVMTLTYDEALDENSVPASETFSVTAEDAATTVDSVSVSGSSVTLTLSSAVTTDVAVTVSYAVPAGQTAARIKDSAGNAAPALISQAVVNVTEQSGNDNSALWSATMTVGVSYGRYGYASFYSRLGALSDRTITLDGNVYTVLSLSYYSNTGSLAVVLDRALSSDFLLRLDGFEFASDDASTLNNGAISYVYSWPKGQLSWSNRDQVQVSVAQKETSQQPEPAENSPATGLPTISGTAQAGQTLTADTSGIADDDGLTNVSYSYQWILNDGSTDTNIQDATGSGYTLVATDAGKTIKVKVTFNDDADNEETLISTATAEVAAGAPTDPPGIPRNLTGTANAEGTVTLRWDAPNDDSVTGYQILRRRPGEGEGTLLAHVNDTGSTATEYTDNDVTPDVLHAYRVKAINAVGLSRQSNFVNVTPTQPAEPAQNSPAAGAPTISGTAQVGETLTVDTLGIGDDDGLTNVFFSYQWIRNDGSTDTDIQGATGSSYALVDVDEGKTIKVDVSFADDAGNNETLSSGATDVVAAPEPPAKPTGLSAIVSHDTVTLTWDNPQDDAITGYVILRRDREIHPQGTFVTITDDTGSADTTYTDDTVEPDKEYVYRIKAINEHGEVSEESDWVRGFTPAAPPTDSPATGEPTITGTAQVGQTLTVDTSGIADEDGLDNAVFAYQWLSDDAEIGGATGSSYTLVDDDEGQTIKVRVTVTDDLGNETTLTSAATEAVEAAPPTDSPATGEPTITGTAQVGQTLTVDTSGIADEDGLDNAVFAYQWLSDDAEIGGATGSSYTLVDDDEGQTIKVRVTVTDDLGNETTLTSAATEAVEAAPPTDSPATGEPTITGTAQVGQTLTVDTSGIADEDGLDNVSYSYQWVVTDGGAYFDISGETGATYTLVAADRGLYILVRVSFTDDAGKREALTSVATDVVAAAA